MKFLTALGEAVLVIALFVLFAAPFFILNNMSAVSSGFSVIAQNFTPGK